jgi:hypothetical protein
MLTLNGFMFAPGITLMASYAEGRTVCEILIEPIRSIIPHDEPARYMRPGVMTEIIDEVFPKADRGKLLLSAVTKSGCNDLETRDDENITIHRFRHRCVLPDPKIEGTATITRKNVVCAATKSHSSSLGH